MECISLTETQCLWTANHNVRQLDIAEQMSQELFLATVKTATSWNRQPCPLSKNNWLTLLLAVQEQTAKLSNFIDRLLYGM